MTWAVQRYPWIGPSAPRGATAKFGPRLNETPGLSPFNLWIYMIATLIHFTFISSYVHVKGYSRELLYTFLFFLFSIFISLSSFSEYSINWLWWQQKLIFGTRKNGPRKNVLQKLFSVKRMLGNLNDFFIFIDWFHYTHKKMFDVYVMILHMHQTVKH